MLGVAGLLAASLLWSPGTSYAVIGIFVFGVALSMGNVMAPATHRVMAAVPKAKAGVGSAMNDVNRMVAGSLGVAVIGSIVGSAYESRVSGATASLPHDAAAATTDSVGAAVAVADRLPAGAGHALQHAAGGAYTDAMGIGLAVGAAVLALSAVAVRRLMPDERRRERHAVEAGPGLVSPVGQTA
jgi:DHA2 family multidrug resistance protein-like MFS transporter